MQKALADGSNEEQQSVLSKSIAILLHLLLFCSSENRTRVVAKLEEKEFEKVDRFALYLGDLAQVIQQVEKGRDKFIILLGNVSQQEAEQSFLTEKVGKGYLTLLSLNYILHALPHFSPQVGARLSRQQSTSKKS